MNREKSIHQLKIKIGETAESMAESIERHFPPREDEIAQGQIDYYGIDPLTAGALGAAALATGLAIEPYAVDEGEVAVKSTFGAFHDKIEEPRRRPYARIRGLQQVSFGEVTQRAIFFGRSEEVAQLEATTGERIIHGGSAIWTQAHGGGGVELAVGVEARIANPMDVMRGKTGWRRKLSLESEPEVLQSMRNASATFLQDLSRQVDIDELLAPGITQSLGEATKEGLQNYLDQTIVHNIPRNRESSLKLRNELAAGTPRNQIDVGIIVGAITIPRLGFSDDIREAIDARAGINTTLKAEKKVQDELGEEGYRTWKYSWATVSAAQEGGVTVANLGGGQEPAGSATLGILGQSAEAKGTKQRLQKTRERLQGRRKR